MKIAICGSGPLAVEAALYFDDLGASVTVFGEGILGGMVRKSFDFFPDIELSDADEVFSSTAKKFLDPNQVKFQTVGEYWEKYLYPLIEKSNIQKLCKLGRVQRVHKRFLGINEEVEGKSRLQDMFRVVYSVNPEDGILKQVKENKEAFEKLGEDVLESLKQSVESFEDFDIVIDATGTVSNPMGPSNTFAINEKNLKLNCPIFYGKEFVENFNKIKELDKITIVGTDANAAVALLSLESFFESNNKRINIITTEEKIFSSLVEISPSLLKRVYNLLGNYHQNLEKKRREYELAVYDWRGLEDHIRVKTPKPIEPISQLEVFTGFNVTSVDRLVDREGLFATCESAEFRKGYDSESSMKTLSTDCIAVFNGKKLNLEICDSLRLKLNFANTSSKDLNGIHPEPGFYTLGPCGKEEYSISDGIKQLDFIKDDILRFFSKA
eukprot:GHVO01007099.1.p1 GENE.GHVO01007099.1~~GHVO01007099.1.p1  ORF type:complete len:439 (+),score=15.39 GHVO01007099.1:259-1575(+)